MMRALYLILFIVFCQEYLAAQLRQEGAFVKYCNNDYLSECTALTKRAKRGEPYLTNITGTSIYPWANNVTLHVTYGIKGYTNMLHIKSKYCDMFHIKWLKDYLENYSNIPTTCPVPPGSYLLYNLEFPPKNFPLPIPQGDIYLSMKIEKTDTRELISDYCLLLRGN